MYQSENQSSQIGQLQQEIQGIKSGLNNKVDSREIHSLTSRVDSLERLCGEISTSLDGFRFELQGLQEKIDFQIIPTA